jgi:hypothetical protein
MNYVKRNNTGRRSLGRRRRRMLILGEPRGSLARRPVFLAVERQVEPSGLGLA